MAKPRIKKYAKGGPIDRKPIVVNDPNDKRLRAYNDSLYVHETSKDGARIAKVLDGKTLSKKTVADIMEKITPDDKKYQDAYYRAGYNHANAEYIQNFKGTYADSREHFGYEGQMSVMPGPVQPIVYQKPVAKAKPSKDYWNTDKDVIAFRETFKKKFGEEPSRDVKEAKYNYDAAYKAGARPVLDSTDGLYHWDSKFKADDHPNRYVGGMDTKTGQPVVTQPTIAPPTYTSEKQMYQGRAFSDSTKLRPGLYHPEEITERMKNPKRSFKKGGTVPQYGNGSTIGSVLGAGVGALGFIGGPALGAMTTGLGMQLGEKVGSTFDNVDAVNDPIKYDIPSITMKGLGTNQNIYAMGGMTGPNAEIELGEVARMPNGQTLIANAPSHENGGLQLNLPMGTQISSDRLKSPLTGNTFAKDQSQLERSKAKVNNTLKYRINDKYAKKAIDILDKESGKMFEIQERSKMLEGIKQQFKTGGVVKYPWGDTVTSDPRMQQLNWGYNPLQNVPTQSTQTINQTQIPFTSNGKQYIVPSVSAGNPSGQAFENGQAVAEASAPATQSNGFSVDTGAIGLGLGLANTGMQFINSMQPEKIERIRNNEYAPALNNYSNAISRQRGLQYNVNDMLNESRESEGATNAFINRNLSSGSVRTGARLGNRAVSLNNTNRIYGDANRANLGIQQSANQMQLGLSEMQANLGAQDAGYQTDYRNMNLQQKAGLRKMRSSALADLSKNFQLYGRDEELMQLLPLMFPNAKLTK